MKKVTFEDIKNSEEIKTYIRQADATLLSLGFTEHSFAHVMRVCEMASRWLLQLGYTKHEAELARIAGYMHDIGNVVNRANHAQSGALLAHTILHGMEMPAQDIAIIISAIGHHDEHTAHPVNAVAAAVILADKTDVRRSRVRNKKTIKFDIHDRVNYAVKKAITSLNTVAKTLSLNLEIDTDICPVVEYFEIFTERMLLCKRACQYLGLEFKLNINGLPLM